MNNSQTPNSTEGEGGQKTPLNLVDSTKQRGESVTGTAAATARSLYDQAKETAGNAYGVVTDRATEKLDEQRSTVSGGLNVVADGVRQVSSNLASSRTESGLAEAAARYTDTAARKIENAANYFENKNVRDMAHDLEGFARRNPAIFIGAAFGLGVLVARFLKSSGDRYAAPRGSSSKAIEPETPVRVLDRDDTMPDFKYRPL